MSGQQGRAVGGSCLGGVAGLVLGVLIGGGIGGGAAPSNPPPNGLLDTGAITGCARAVSTLIGAGIGGMVGALGGAVLGAGLATVSRKDASDATPNCPQARETDYSDLRRTLLTPDRPQAMETDPSPSAQESSEAELARLKARVADLEGMTRIKDQPAGSEGIQEPRAEPDAADRPRD